jgi:Cys-rich protein (TIGR01571 family)
MYSAFPSDAAPSAAPAAAFYSAAPPTFAAGAFPGAMAIPMAVAMAPPVAVSSGDALLLELAAQGKSTVRPETRGSIASAADTYRDRDDAGGCGSVSAPGTVVEPYVWHREWWRAFLTPVSDREEITLRGTDDDRTEIRQWRRSYVNTLLSNDGVQVREIVTDDSEKKHEELIQRLSVMHGVTAPPGPPVRQWRHPLMSACCSSPALALEMVLCFPCLAGRVWQLAVESVPMKLASADTTGVSTKGLLPSWAPGRAAAANPCTALFWFLFLPLHLVSGILTCCGLPCTETPPPCFGEYQLRRLVAEKHNIAESPLESKINTVFCYPCALAQTLREAESIGIWYGLTLCSGAQPDLARDWPQPPSFEKIPGLARAMSTPAPPPPFASAVMML